jgi:hypothetical protein
MYKDPAGSEYHAFLAGIKFNKLRGINEGAEFNSPRLHQSIAAERLAVGQVSRTGPGQQLCFADRAGRGDRIHIS